MISHFFVKLLILLKVKIEAEPVRVDRLELLEAGRLYILGMIPEVANVHVSQGLPRVNKSWILRDDRLSQPDLFLQRDFVLILPLGLACLVFNILF